MTFVIPLLFQTAFVLLVVTAAVTDYRRMKIPNWISLSLLGLFMAYAFSIDSWSNVGWHFIIGLGVFAAAIATYAIGMFGGGDVKLLGAIALWAGPEHVVEFLMLTGLLGGLLGLLIYGARHILAWYPALADRPAAIYNIARWGRDGTCPYGIAISIAAILSVPAMFAS